MNYRTTFILGGIFLALLLLLAVAITIGPENGDQGRALFPELLKTAGVDVNPGENILAVRLERSKPEKQTLVLKREGQGGSWRFEDPFRGPADGFAVNNLVRAVLEGRREEDRDAGAGASQTGLDEPVATVTLTGKDGKEHSLVVGRTVPGATGNLVFVRTSGRGKTPQVVMERDLEPLFRPVGVLRERSLLGSETDLEQFKLSTGPVGAKPPVALRKGQGVWRYETPSLGLAEPAALPGAGAQQTGPDVGAILRAIAALRVEQVGERPGERNDFIADGVTDLAAHGLDGSKNRVLRVEVERTPPGRDAGAPDKGEAAVPKVALLIALDKAVEKNAEKAPENPAQKPASNAVPFKGYPAMVEGGGSVVLVPSGPVTELLRLLEDPALIRDRAVARLSGEPDWIEIRNGLGRMDLVRTENQGAYQLFRPGQAEGQPVEATAVSGLLEALKNSRGRFVEDLPEKRKELELDRPADQQVAVRLWLGGVEKADLSGEKKAEKKEEKSSPKPKRKEVPASAEIILGRRQGEDVALLRVSGKDQAILLAPKSLLDLAEQGPLAYLNRKLPSYAGEGIVGETALDQVIGVTLSRGAETRTVSRKDKSQPWTFTAPADRAALPVEAQAIRSLLVNLGTLQARKLVAEKPTSQELASQGLEPPALLVTLVVSGPEGKTQNKTFAMGKESGDGGVFARASWVDRVFTVDLSLRSILEAPWENRALFSNLDPAKVTRLKLAGWQAVNGAPVSLVLEKDKEKWIAKDPGSDFPVAQAKVDQLLGSLKGLRFEKVLAYSGGGDPALGLDPAKNGLAIEWTLEGQKEPVRMVLGRMEGTGLAASVSTLPGMALVVPKAPFEEALQGRGKFRQ